MEENNDISTSTSEQNPLEESILVSIKKMIGITKDNTDFDTDIIIHINSVFATLRQLGVGPINGYRITSSNNKWEEFVKNEEMLDSVKTYIYLKTKLIFDPPLNGSLLESFQRQANELEWRLNVAVESDQLGGEENE